MTEAKTDTKPEKKTAEKKTAEPRPNRLATYLRQTRGELRKVHWPTRQESQRLTVIVLGVTLVMAAFLGLLDFLFSNGLRSVVSLVLGT